jgi:two-component system CheB/CheR fusion protein
MPRRTAENIAGRDDIFDTVNPSAKLFRRRGAQRQSVMMPLFVQPLAHAVPRGDGADRPRGAVPERSDPVARRILERYAPAHVLVNAENDVIRASTRTGTYLELAEGAPSTKITALARSGLRSSIRGVLETARRTRKRAINRDVRVAIDDETARGVDVVADPVGEDEVLLVFQDVAARRGDAEAEADVQVDGYSSEERIKQLEDELGEARTRLRTTVEELETSNEELKSSNEEMMSMNEQLQSTNEELATVNEELENKVDQLARANRDLTNFTESTQVPTIFLDRKMRIRSFTPATKTLFRFQDQDRGRPLADVVSRIDHRQLEALGRTVLETGDPIEQEITIDDGQASFVLRVLPYREFDEAVGGVILVFSDVTKIRQAQADLALKEGIARQRSAEIETLYKTAPVGMALLDRKRRHAALKG